MMSDSDLESNLSDSAEANGLTRRRFLVQSAAGMAGIAVGSCPALLSGEKTGPQPHTASPFLLGWSEGMLTSLRFQGDEFPTDYLAPGQRLGDLLMSWRSAGGTWNRMDTSALSGLNRQLVQVENAGTAVRYWATNAAGRQLEVDVRLRTDGEALRWSLVLRNLSTSSLEVGDLALPLRMHTEFKGGDPPSASVLKHSFISGSGSFLFWMRSNSVGPYLMMTPEKSTSLEYWERTHPADKSPAVFRAYIHSVAEGEKVAAAGGRWRQPHTSATLAPAGRPGSTREYAFRLQWAQNYAEVEEKLVDAGLLDVQVTPGMTVPTDLFVEVALRSSNAVHAVKAEYPEQTAIERLPARGAYRHCYRVRFARLGENLITVHQADGRVTRLEFFATEPVETLIRKRGAFVAGHQHRDPSKWYNGLLAEWNMDDHVMLGPDNYDRITGWRIYEVTCDDPGLSKPAFLASKLAEFPDQQQVAGLDDYIQHFVWGGLQRTTEESDSYGIYGILDWKRNRESSDPGDKGRRHMWRPYDYPHIVAMYWGMYRVARDYPGIRTHLSQEQYLERAYGTALALFTVPKRIIGWEAYETGFYNEVVIVALMDELERVGHTEKAAALRHEWEKKVRFFLTNGPDLFGSEYAFDSTGFESTEALARYALDRTASGETMHLPAPDSLRKEGAAEIAPVTQGQAKAFAEKQMQANLFCRGVVEKAYYTYGSDYRAEGGDAYTLSYMAQMGGWAVLDHALRDRSVPYATVRLGYASYLSAWALMNTGTAESNYGYWFPGAENDGGAGGGFEPAAMGRTWLGQPHHRGSWYYSSEEDLGFCGALRAARTVVADDAVFGRFCFGGMMQQGSPTVVSPRDGVRRRFSLLTNERHVDIEVLGARFQPDKSVVFSAEEGAWTFLLERHPPSSGDVRITISGLKTGKYSLQTAEETSIADCTSVLELRFNFKTNEATIHLRPA